MDWTDAPEKHPVCAAVLSKVGAGKRGKEVRDVFESSPYGWPGDAVDGALVILHTTGHLRATHKGMTLAPKQLDQSKISVAEFRAETATLNAKENLYSHAKELVGDPDPRSHEFSVQLRAMDADRSGCGLGLPVLVALSGSSMERSTKGGLILVGSLNLGESVEMIPNPVAVAELAVEKGASQLLMPISARRQLLDLLDEMATRLNIIFYADPTDAFVKAILE